MRKTRMSKSIMKRIAAILSANGANVSAACSEVGISRTTWYKYKDKWPEFEALYGEACKKSVDNVESSLYRQAIEGNITACIFYLTNRDPERWKHRNSLDIEEIEITGEELRALTMEELRELSNGEISVKSAKILAASRSKESSKGRDST